MRSMSPPLALSTTLLTSRELEILRYVAQGFTNKAIATRLCLCETTVASHLKAISRKLNVHNRTQAVRAGYEQGLLVPVKKTTRSGRKPCTSV